MFLPYPGICFPLLILLRDSMPVILPKEKEKEWLNPDNQNLEELQSILEPCPSKDMECYQVSPLVNSPANDTPECTEAV
ncbi:MAG: SOS response-associated peptidase [Deltaproteobacteria bacterium]|nr:SOS response-associated peptidase [Deltaproteobacteria bacterium]